MEDGLCVSFFPLLCIPPIGPQVGEPISGCDLPGKESLAPVPRTQRGILK